jgi:hypothetical protein
VVRKTNEPEICSLNTRCWYVGMYVIDIFKLPNQEYLTIWNMGRNKFQKKSTGVVYLSVYVCTTNGREKKGKEIVGGSYYERWILY